MSRKLGLICVTLVAIPALLGITGRPHASESFTLVVGGNTQGYLSPCGCTKPMTGGIRRRASITKLLSHDDAVVIETGPLISGPGRQSELKAETLAETMRAMGVSILALGGSDLTLGPAGIDAVARLSGADIVNRLDDEPRVVAPLATYGDLGPPQKTLEQAIERAKRLCEAAHESGLPSVYITQFGAVEAKKIAQAVPNLNAVVYRSESNPDSKEVREGQTLLLTPGPHSQFVVTAQWDGSRFSRPAVYPLGPDVPDDPAAERYYDRYLDRVTAENLVLMMPKTTDADYAGSASCQPCHRDAFSLWEKSEHSHAFATLEQVKHQADPDCVGCHVVGIESSNGFRSAERTPQFRNVGCESCHGSGAAHVAQPKERPMPHVGEQSCQGCHNLQNSPNFDFGTYWSKIKH